VIGDENNVGKTNLLYALRLALNPDFARQRLPPETGRRPAA
jgi:predicted ATP-dependent endonuclease of OLD family